MMKRVFVTLFIITAASVVCFSQSTLHYTYDNAGNRTARTIIIGSQQSPRHNAAQRSDMFEDSRIKISGREANLLHVEIFELKGTAHVSIYDSSGKQYVSIDTSSSINDIDISIVPVGIYVLRIEANNEVNTWKLIKN